MGFHPIAGWHGCTPTQDQTIGLIKDGMLPGTQENGPDPEFPILQGFKSLRLIPF